MAKNLHRGKCFCILLYLLFTLSSVSGAMGSSNSVSIKHEHDLYCEPETELICKLNQQQVLLNKLEDLVGNLSEIVTRLESRLSESPKVEITGDERGDREKDKRSQRGPEDERIVRGLEDQGFEGKAREGERRKAVSVTKYSPFWSEKFEFASAVKLDSDATCINLLPFRDYEGLTKYVAVGDERGRVYVFLRNGDVLIEYFTMTESPITAMLSYMSVYKNESVVVTGHQNGEILKHRFWEGSNVEEWSSVFMKNMGKFVLAESGEDQSPISILEVHHVGRMRYVLSVDNIGKIRVFTESGTLYGSTMPKSRPLTFLKQRLLFLTESGAGSLDLRSMKVKESECEGLNHSLAHNYAFDATERSKAYGFTSEGDLIHILLLGDVSNFKCRVRSKRKFDLDEPLAFQAIKGYLLVVGNERVFVYNVSSRHYARAGAPRLVFSAGLDEIRSSFLSSQTVDVDARRRAIPLVASDREKLVVLGLGSGYVGIYHSSLPVFKGEYNTILWTSPVLFFVLFLFASWHFFAKKKEALTSWGPDDPFSSTSATTGAPLGTGSGDRSFVDSSSRGADVMDLRGGGLRGPPRRYVSPPRYPGGATNSFRPGSSVDHNSRPTSVDANFRASSELKFRGSPLESSGFPKRRESLFINNQVVDESN